MSDEESEHIPVDDGDDDPYDGDEDRDGDGEDDGEGDEEGEGEEERETEGDGEGDEYAPEDGTEETIETDTDVIGLKKLVDRRQKLFDVTITKPPERLTKYELTAIIGFRAQSLAEGAPPYIQVHPDMDPIAIAIAEFDNNLIPLVIDRPFPSNKMGRFKYETYKLDELINTISYK